MPDFPISPKWPTWVSSKQKKTRNVITLTADKAWLNVGNKMLPTAKIWERERKVVSKIFLAWFLSRAGRQAGNLWTVYRSPTYLRHSCSLKGVVCKCCEAFSVFVLFSLSLCFPHGSDGKKHPLGTFPKDQIFNDEISTFLNPFYLQASYVATIWSKSKIW